MTVAEAIATLRYVLREGSINSADRIYIESAIKELEEAPKIYPPLFRLDEEFPEDASDIEPRDCCP